MSIQNKKLNIVSDTNFDGNKITDAKINAQENSISNLETSNFKSDVIQSVVRDGTYATNTSIPTEKAVSDALDKKQDGLPEQSSNSGKYLTTDGTTVSWGEVNANYLYDTKVLSQAISNKGWAYQCKSVRTDLAKADVPTVYNDIEYKYLNCDKVPSSSLTQLAGTSPYKTVDIDDTYVYSGNTTDWKLKRTRLDNLPAVNWETVVNSQLYANQSYRALCVGEKILIASFSGANGSINIRVYKKSDWTLLKTYTHTYNNGMNSYCSSIYIGSVRKFVIGYKDTDSNTNSSYMVFLEDNDTLQETAYTLPYQQNCIPVYINGYYIFMHRNKEQITKYITRTTDFINFENVYSYDGWSYDNVQPIGKAGNKLVCFYLRRISSDNGETWITDNSIPNCDAPSICQKENSFYVISGNRILFSDNLPSFTTVYTGASNLGNFITVNDSADMFFIKKDYPLYFLGYNSVVYTDTYIINGSTVNIQYYKYNDWKICIAGENGTSDVNLDTVFNYLGYLNYWRLDRNGQTVTLPRNSNLYTQMFVGDDYDDTEDNLITADWSATALKSELDIIPDQTDNAGKFLTTDGSTLSWAEVQGGTTIRQVDYYELAEVDDTTDITGTIEIDKDIYLGEITDDRVVKSYTYDGSVWKNDSNDTVSLTTLGIDISNATYSLNSSFDVYSVCLRNKTSFTVSRTITAINCLYLNGNLQLKKDYNVTTTEIDGQEFPTIEFNDYTLKSTDSISII